LIDRGPSRSLANRPAAWYEIDMGGPLLQLPWGGERITLELPERWRLAGVLEPAARSGLPDATGETRRSMREPIGSPPLRQLCRSGAKTVVVVDDSSRPTPVGRILPAVLEELEASGIPRDRVTVVAALGVHRSMSEAEIAQRTGLPGLCWQNHDCFDPERLVMLGTTRRGTPVLVNRTVAEADLVVSIGSIEPHLIASFGGGYKNIVPGVAGAQTIARNHSLNCRPDTFNMVGQPMDRNPMRLDLEEAGRLLGAPVFLVNAVLNASQQVVRVVSGDPVAAHREGARTSQDIYGVPIPSPADVVIASSHPMDQDVRQGSKALANTIRAVRRGGVLIVLMRATEGLGVFGLADRKLPVGRGGLKALAPVLVRLLPRLKLGGMADDERFYLYFALQAMRHCRLLVYAPTIPADKRAGFPFAELVDTPGEAIARAVRSAPADAAVLAFPHGGVTYPVPPD
jgi:nickel-dependent lactate racemase